uniref:Uncharacterized protein n=1 Tax=Oryza barthii TaxID=65489 RepID=A0A0D3FFH3_9ORYZ
MLHHKKILMAVCFSVGLRQRWRRRGLAVVLACDGDEVVEVGEKYRPEGYFGQPECEIRWKWRELVQMAKQMFGIGWKWHFNDAIPWNGIVAKPTLDSGSMSNLSFKRRGCMQNDVCTTHD